MSVYRLLYWSLAETYKRNFYLSKATMKWLISDSMEADLLP